MRYVVFGSTVLDVGAHIGALTVPMARLVGPQGRVYAFEPQKKVFRELVHNLKLNGLSNTIPLRMAVSSEPGVVEMNAVTTQDGRVGIGSGRDEVEARTVDSFGFSNVSVIKIDVEGHETHVRWGARDTIDAFRPVIFLEIRRENLELTRLLLEAFGYHLRRLRRRDYIATFGNDQTER